MSAQPGDLGLAVIGGFIGKLIRVGQWIAGDGSKWTHVFVVLDDGNIIEAEPGGARVVPQSQYKLTDVAFVHLPLTDEQRSAVTAAAMKYNHVPYSFLDYGAIGLHRLGFNADWLYRYIKNTGHQICSQLGDQVVHDIGFHMFNDDRWPGLVTPGSIARLAEQQGWVE